MTGYVSKLLQKTLGLKVIGQEQLEAIRARSKPGNTIAFFCPDEAFRKNFGRIPDILEQRGYVVLYLYGTKVGDEFEKKPNAFYVGGGLIEQVDCVDLFITATIMDVLPENSRKALLVHGSFASFAPENHEAAIDDLVDTALPLAEQFECAISARTHFSAFARIYDYYLMSTPFFVEGLIYPLFSEGYNLQRMGCQPVKKELHQHFDIFNKVLAVRGKHLPKRIYVVPAGYPQIDANIRHKEKFTGLKDTITFAPTPLNGKQAWNQYSALYNAGIDIIGALLEHFPNYRIVFKPHVSDMNNPSTEEVISHYEGHPNFYLDKSGSNYYELYARTAALISDFSSTAYTFALGTLSPVLFYSPTEESIPPALKSEPYCALRTEIGLVSSDTTDMVEKLNLLLSNVEVYKNRIAEFRSRHLYNPGSSEEYICDAIGKMLAGIADPSWECFDNTRLDSELSVSIPKHGVPIESPILIGVLSQYNIVRFRQHYFAVPEDGIPIELDKLSLDGLFSFDHSKSFLVIAFRVRLKQIFGKLTKKKLNKRKD